MKSMTAFSRKEVSTANGSFNLEMRTVNHRFLDINLRLAEEIRFIEPVLRQMIADTLSRGRVDLTIRFQPAVASLAGINEDAVKQLLAYEGTLRQYSREMPGLSCAEILQWPGVLDVTAQDEKALASTLKKLLETALLELQKQRAREGGKIRVLLEQRIGSILEIIADVRNLLPQVSRAFREGFQEKLARMEVDVDDHRLEQELTLYLGKQDIAEELDRLEVHLQETTDALSISGALGRRLDFLMQELNRETNTMTSKSVDARLNKAAVDIKVLIEQMREQIQNLE